jgi:hypothetical protein
MFSISKVAGESIKERSAPIVVQLAPLQPSSSLFSLIRVSRSERQRCRPKEEPDVAVGPVEDRVDAHELRSRGARGR